MRKLNDTLDSLPSNPMKMKSKEHCTNHHDRLLGMRDAMDILSGKWKIPLLGALIVLGKMRFMDLLREVDGIAAKMLSKELQELESNKLVKRTVKETKPVTVEYEITEYGLSLEPLIIVITNWGLNHRKMIMKSGEEPVRTSKESKLEEVVI